MIGQWLGTFFGRWFGGWLSPDSPDLQPDLRYIVWGFRDSITEAPVRWDVESQRRGALRAPARKVSASAEPRADAVTTEWVTRTNANYYDRVVRGDSKRIVR